VSSQTLHTNLYIEPIIKPCSQTLSCEHARQLPTKIADTVNYKAIELQQL
jgi:hypothetical protein